MIAHSFRGEAFGPAQRLHGATYVVDVEFRRESLDADGLSWTSACASATLRRLLADLNFRNLDEVPEFAGRNTTTEFLARALFDRLAAAIGEGHLGHGAAGIESIRVTFTNPTSPLHRSTAASTRSPSRSGWRTRSRSFSWSRAASTRAPAVRFTTGEWPRVFVSVAGPSTSWNWTRRFPFRPLARSARRGSLRLHPRWLPRDCGRTRPERHARSGGNQPDRGLPSSRSSTCHWSKALDQTPT